eukprot:4656223-Pyramimonas_sp.AAC.1
MVVECFVIGAMLIGAARAIGRSAHCGADGHSPPLDRATASATMLGSEPGDRRRTAHRRP